MTTWNKSKYLFAPLSFLFLLAFMALNFQNCSGASSSSYGDPTRAGQSQGGVIDRPTGGGSGGPADPGVLPLQLNLNFKADQSYYGEVLVSSSSFVDSMISKMDYPTYTLGKAIALSESGLGYMAMTDSKSDEEAKRMAIESCNLLSGAACAAVVVGDLYAIDGSDFRSNLTYRLEGLKGSTLDKSKIPMSSSFIRNSNLVKNYQSASGNKALAVSATGALYATFTEYLNLTEVDAKRMAVQQCELESALSPCILYAYNNQVVFDPMKWVKISKIDFTNNNVAGLSPPASHTGALDPIKELIKKLGRDRKYAIYITPNGFGFYGEGATKSEAKAQGVQKCENYPYSGRCIEYATSAGVTLSADSLNGKIHYPEFFCKMPRYSCNEHFRMKCPNGEYWVQDAITLRAERVQCSK